MSYVPPSPERSLNDDRMERLATYVTLCLPILGLDMWEVRLKWDRRPTEDAHAQIDVTKNRMQAALLIAEDFFAEQPDVQRHVICHELVHLYTDPLDQVVWDGNMADLVGTVLWRSFTGAYHAGVERMVDRLATLVEGGLPIPELG